jgi:hypothetical protein
MWPSTHPAVHHLNRKFVINMTQLWINGKQVTNFCLPSIWTMAIRNAFCVHLVSWMSFPMVIYSLYILHCKCRLELFHTQNLYSCHVLLLLSPHQTWMKYHTPWWGSVTNSQISIKYFWGAYIWTHGFFHFSCFQDVHKECIYTKHFNSFYSFPILTNKQFFGHL